ncbi:MAG TPA: MBL fold metallo-hydrolase, partial [Cytophagaceae bacterium]|nr:MBL fold metallo-hydrolase [Cytophagaceae bacterium]
NAESQSIFPFDPSSLDVVLLTHAHIDHTGRLPQLLKSGYNGQIVCTTPTFGLAQILLNDNASLSSKRLKRLVNRAYRYTHREEEIEILTLKEVEETMDRFVTISFNHRFQIHTKIWITFIPTGHLLGAGNILLEIEEKGELKKILFSGDLGRKNYPLLPDPSPVPNVDFLVCETTYGNRSHQERGNPEDVIERIIKETCVEKAGRLIIPAFSVGRTQSIIYTLHKLFLQGRLPKIKIFTDSPMAEVSSRIYEEFHSLLNEEAKTIFAEHKTLFDFDNLIYVANFKESKAITNYYEPCIIISASGMLTGGRMEMHVKKNLNNPYCTFLMIGYSAEGTPGHRLMSGGKFLRIGGKDIPITASIERTDIYSGHAGKEDLLDFVRQQDKNTLKNIFLVHGEYQSMIDFRENLKEEGFNRCEIPSKGESFFLL